MKSKTFLGLFLTAALVIAAMPALAQLEGRTFPTNKPAGELNVLTDQEKADGWQLLFNGKDIEGWEFDRDGVWKVEDGVIISRNGTTHLFTKKKYKNFILSWDVCAYDVAVPKKRFGNSGVFVRGVKTDSAFPKGYEVQVDPYDIDNPTGGIYGRAPGNLLVENGQWKPEAFFEVHEGKWINQKVSCEDNHFKVWINGKLSLDWEDEQKAFPDAGYIALQNHHPTDIVLFANIKIKVLDKE